MPKHNATRHGAYAHDIVLPWEDQKEFATLYESFRRDLNPLNALQEEAVRNWPACIGASVGSEGDKCCSSIKIRRRQN